MNRQLKISIALILLLNFNNDDLPGQSKEKESFDYFFRLISNGALEKAETELEQFNRNKKANQSKTEYLLLKGLLSFSFFKFDEALVHLTHAEELMGSADANSLDRGRLSHFKGILFLKGFYKSEIALDFLRQAEEIYKIKSPPFYYLADIYFQLGRAYKDIGDIGNSKYHILKSIDIYENNEQEFAIQIADNLNTLAAIEIDLNHMQSAVTLFDKAIHKAELKKKEHLLTSKIYDNLGFAYAMIKNEKQSLKSFHKSLSIAKKYSYGQFWMSNSYLNLGEHYLLNKVYDSAFFYLKKSSQSRDIIFNERNFERAEAYQHIAIFFRETGSFDSARFYFDKALSPYNGIVENKNIDGSNNNEDYLLAIILIAEKAQLNIDEFLSDSTRVRKLIDANTLFNRMDELSRECYRNFFWENSHGYIHDIMKANYEKAIYVAYLLFRHTGNIEYANDGLRIMESSKAQILLQNLMISKTVSGNTDAMKMRNRELSLKKRLDIAQFRDNLVGNPIPDRSIRKEIIKLSDSLTQLYHALRRSDINYYDSRFQKKFDLDLSRTFQKNQHVDLLDFFYGNDALYSIAIGDNGVCDFQRITHDKTADQKIDSLLLLINRVPEITKAQERALAYEELSYFVFQRLLEKPLKVLTKSKIIIVPDGLLFKLPFEALARSRNSTHSFSKMDYIGMHYIISYGYSLGSLVRKPNKESSGTALAAFGYSDEEQGTKKISSSQEIRNLSNLIDAKIYEGADATKEAIKTALRSDRTVHFALHSIGSSLDGRSSIILPEADTLYTYEIYEIPVNASLIHLNACETMVGVDNASEGVIGLARAFLFSGAQSVVANLWAIEDSHARTMALDFYEKLSNGSPAAEALALAKRDVIIEGDEFVSHPYYWAGTILIGQPSNLRNIFNSNLIYYALLVIGLITVAILWLKKRFTL